MIDDGQPCRGIPTSTRTVGTPRRAVVDGVGIAAGLSGVRRLLLGRQALPGRPRQRGKAVAPYAPVGRTGPLMAALVLLASAALGAVNPTPASAVPALAPVTGPTEARGSWPQFGHDPAHSGFNPDETSLTPANVSGLQEVWTAGLSQPGGLASPAVAGGVVYAATAQLYAFDAAGSTGCSGPPKTCTPLWAGGGGGFSSTPAVAGGVVYVGSRDGRLQAFDASGSTGCSGTPKTCAPLWTGQTGAAIFSSPSVVDGVVYVGSDDQKLYAFDAAGSTGCSGAPKTCTPLWTAPTVGAVQSSPAVADGVVYVGSTNGYFYAFDASGTAGCSGTPKVCGPLWTSDVGIGEGFRSSPTVAGGVVYIGSGLGRLFAFDAGGSNGCSGTPKTCEPLWRASVMFTMVGTPAVAGGVLYVNGGQGNIYAFDAAGSTGCSGAPKTCAPLWTTAATGNASFSSPAVAGGVVYVGSLDRRLYGFDAAGLIGCSGTPKTCAPLWRSGQTAHLIDSSPAVVGGTVYVLSNDGTLHAYSGPPMVTIDQASGQPDPDSTAPIDFTAAFTKPVTGFTGADVSFAGSTAPGTLVATTTGQGATYNVAVSGMTGAGTVVVSIPAGVATDLTDQANLASTSTDNTVAFAPSDLSVSLEDAPDPVALGDTYAYTVTVTNRGAATTAATSATLSLSGASHTVLSASASQGSCTVGAAVSCALGTMAADGTATVTVTVEPNATGSISATATVSAAEADPTASNDTAETSTTVDNAHGCTIMGTPGPDTLTGTSGADVICALSGDDAVSGRNGNDIIYAGSGNDRSHGESLLALLGLFDNGSDTIHGGPGDDDLDGGNGSDTLIDNEGTDTLTGGNGNDTIVTADGAGGDTAHGGFGIDTCRTDPDDNRSSC